MLAGQFRQPLVWFATWYSMMQKYTGELFDAMVIAFDIMIIMGFRTMKEPPKKWVPYNLKNTAILSCHWLWLTLPQSPSWGCGALHPVAFSKRLRRPVTAPSLLRLKKGDGEASALLRPGGQPMAMGIDMNWPCSMGKSIYKWINMEVCRGLSIATWKKHVEKPGQVMVNRLSHQDDVFNIWEIQGNLLNSCLKRSSP